jgi:hypothetical protein
MMTTTTTNTTFPALPEKFVREGHCPTCGAGIYINAQDCDINGEYCTLPTPYYTCNCRLNNVLNPTVNPLNPVVPFTPYPTTAPPWVTNERNGTGDFPNVDDWARKTFCGSGSITQDPHLRVTCWLK